MRTTLDIDEDLLQAAKEIARRERSTAGAVVSRLLRQSLSGAQPTWTKARRGAAVAGFLPFAARPGVIVTDELVQRLRKSEGV